MMTPNVKQYFVCEISQNSTTMYIPVSESPPNHIWVFEQKSIRKHDAPLGHVKIVLLTTYKYLAHNSTYVGGFQVMQKKLLTG